MIYVNLLLSQDDGAGLEVVAAKFFTSIGVTAYEERESSNYVDGRYLKGEIGGLSITVSLSDEADHADLPVWVQLASDAVDREALDDEVSSIIQTKVLPSGFKCARMLNFGRKDERRIDYLPSS